MNVDYMGMAPKGKQSDEEEEKQRRLKRVGLSRSGVGEDKVLERNLNEVSERVTRNSEGDPPTSIKNGVDPKPSNGVKRKTDSIRSTNPVLKPSENPWLDPTSRVFSQIIENAVEGVNYVVRSPFYGRGDAVPTFFGEGYTIKGSNDSQDLAISGLLTITPFFEFGFAAKGGSSWVYGAFKTEAKWAGQLSKRGWTAEQITEAVTKGKSFDAVNMVNKANSATRYVHPTTGQSVVIDNVTKELLHVGGP